jgi:hypothetical protein
MKKLYTNIAGKIIIGVENTVEESYEPKIHILYNEFTNKNISGQL